MKKINFTICLALTIMTFSSCSEDKTIPDGGTPPKEGGTVVTATVDNNETRTTLNNTDVLWSAGDAFAAFPKSGDAVAALKFDLDDAGGTSTGTFAATGTFDVGQRYAFYPHAAGITLADDVVSFVLPQTQSYVASSFGNGANPAVATSADDTFAFKNLCGVLQIKLTGNGKVESIDITSDQNISGAATATFGDAPVITMTGTDAANKTITLDCGDGVELHATNVTSFYVVLPPATHALNVKLNNTDGKEVNATAVVITRSKIKPMASVVMNLISGFNYYGAANSVIVPSANTNGVIDATAYILTGDDFIYQDNAGTTTATKAELIWEDTNNMISNVVYTPSTQKITFNKAASATGNAVIALYNAANEVVWSFHVWVPESDPTAALKTYATTAATNTYQVLPLNLGATHVLTNAAGEDKLKGVGLYYQWGRKDPLGSTAHSGDIAFQSVYKAGSELTGFFMGENVKDITVISHSGLTSLTLNLDMINYAIKNPATFISNNDWGTVPSQVGNWVGTLNNKLWGNPIGHKLPYPAATLIKKSIFDPCPEGYLVAPRDLYLNFKTPDPGGVVNSPEADDHSANKGWNLYYEGNKTGAQDFYVKAGYRGWGDGKMVAAALGGVHQWNSTPFNAADDADKHGGTFDCTSWLSVLGGLQRGDAATIRCVKIQI